MCMGTSPSFSTLFPKGDNLSDFLFALLAGDSFPKKGSTLKEEFAPRGANSFL